MKQYNLDCNALKYYLTKEDLKKVDTFEIDNQEIPKIEVKAIIKAAEIRRKEDIVEVEIEGIKFLVRFISKTQLHILKK